MYDFLEMFNVNFLQRSELIIEIQIRLNILDLDLYHCINTWSLFCLGEEEIHVWWAQRHTPDKEISQVQYCKDDNKCRLFLTLNFDYFFTMIIFKRNSTVENSNSR